VSDADEQVRRLLASARLDEPLPTDVGARLDDVLAGLVAARAKGGAVESGPAPAEDAAEDAAEGAVEGQAAPAAPYDLARRRRRVVTWAVAAAASVVVGGVAVGQLVGTGQDSATTAQSDATSAGPQAGNRSQDGGGAAGSAPEESAPGQAEGSQGPGAALSPDGGADAPGPLVAPDPVVLSPATVEQGLLAARAVGASPATRARLGQEGCLPALVRPRDEVWAVLYDGRPGAAVLRPATAAGQRALLVLCGETAVTRSLLLPPAP
jgi:hypothetical protein